MMSGQRLTVEFRQGWAVRPFGVAHYYVESVAPPVLTAICRRATALPSQLFEPGTWTHCKLCSAKLAKQSSASGR